MTETSTSPRYLPPSSSAAPRPPKSSASPAGRPSPRPGSVAHAMPPSFPSSRPFATPFHPPSSSTTHRAASAGYFGFPITSTESPAQHTLNGWGSPSSTVRSTAAVSPSLMPLDQNPDFEAFRRQSEGKSFSLGNLGRDSGADRVGTPRRTSADTFHEVRIGRRPSAARAPSVGEIKGNALEPPLNELSRSPKRMLSPASVMLTDDVRRAPPANLAHSDSTPASAKGRSLDSLPRFANVDCAPYAGLSIGRAETLPAAPPPDAQLLITPQHAVNLFDSRPDDVLLLDLRVATHYFKSHISHALNLCIPTTLLKRPSFNVHKLADTFKDERQRAKFDSWKTCSYIIVYDASSSLLKDATTCLNTIRKFRSEGYEGTTYIIRGGFVDFARRFPAYTEHYTDASQTDSSSPGVDSDGPEVAPVAGGCPMPSSDQPANPFFGNIRQNMDLIGGVGQIALQHPDAATSATEKDFPSWLKHAADRDDDGKDVAQKFEQIEKREKKRMEEALSCKVSYGPTNDQGSTAKPPVQIAGLEKGNKNRYNNIWPFEHSRVRLQGVPAHGCDYFNANHIRAGWSHKRYISTQAPIPGTFNDFWNVVWQQDVRVIVMLTAEREGAQLKAHNYWDRKQYGPLRLDFHSERKASIEPSRIRRHRGQRRDRRSASYAQRASSNSLFLTPLDTKDERAAAASDNGATTQSTASQPPPPHVVVRRFTLSHDRHPFEPMREITQLHYSAWPDFGAPAQPAHLLGLVEQTAAVSRAAERSSSSRRNSAEDASGRDSGSDAEPVPPHTRPVLVHCSAGCGRTGTFCTVDSVIDMIKRQRADHSHSSADVAMQSPQMQDRQLTPMDVDRGTSVAAAASSSFESPAVDADDAEVAAVNGPWLGRDDVDLVATAVEDFRGQRISMVQSLRQFVLCYESVMEWLVDERIAATEKAAVDG